MGPFSSSFYMGMLGRMWRQIPSFVQNQNRITVVS